MGVDVLQPTSIAGTGAGTGIRAATDVAKESGLSEAGGYPLVADWTDPRYIGHGVGHRNPKTGAPVPATVHIPTDGELNPHNYASAAAAADEDPEAARQRTRDAFAGKYGPARPSAYRAAVCRLLGRIQCAVGRTAAGQELLERARLEHAAYAVDHSEIHFRGEAKRR
ncbi:hypothetical protein H4R18_000149 [Coemansia javaensis]|uniref:Uncharacterized protein n=1 Tax=Coemansia javaensis TaxID=2761396 RepID=A0A9W8HM53_9FUNG|nr:hypothetical protein H4R18_000149 [Coemansia javaensis]